MKGLCTRSGEAAKGLTACVESSAIKSNNVSRVAVMGKRSQCAPWNGLCEIHRGNKMRGNVQFCFLLALSEVSCSEPRTPEVPPGLGIGYSPWFKCLFTFYHISRAKKGAKCRDRV